MAMDQERIIGEIQENLLAQYRKGGGGERRAAGGDLNDAVDEHPIRDPDRYQAHTPTP